MKPQLSQSEYRALCAWADVTHVHNLINRALDARLRAEHGISSIEVIVLAALIVAPDGVPMAELARRAMTSKSGLSQLMTVMESKGLVERHRSSHDRRVTLATATVDGGEAFAAALPVMADELEARFAPLVEPATGQLFTAAMQQLIRSMGEQPASDKLPDLTQPAAD